MAVRAEEINVQPIDVVNAEENSTELQFQAKIEKLLFIGDQYESFIILENGDKHHLYLPKTNEWYEGQKIVLGVKRGLTVWPN